MNLRKNTSSIFSITLNNGNKLDVIITYEAKQLFVNYINSHPLYKKHETRCSGIENIVENIENYFQIQLKNYHNVLVMINLGKGIFTENIMKQWIKENYNERMKKCK